MRILIGLFILCLLLPFLFKCLEGMDVDYSTKGMDVVYSTKELDEEIHYTEEQEMKKLLNKKELNP